MRQEIVNGITQITIDELDQILPSPQQVLDLTGLARYCLHTAREVAQRLFYVPDEFRICIDPSVEQWPHGWDGKREIFVRTIWVKVKNREAPFDNLLAVIDTDRQEISLTQELQIGTSTTVFVAPPGDEIKAIVVS